MLVVPCGGRGNAGKSAVLNALAGRRVASVSRQPGHTRSVQTARLSPRLVVRDTPALDAADPAAWPLADGCGGLATGHACALCGLLSTGAIRSPLGAVAAAAERAAVEAAYGLQPNELREAAEAGGGGATRVAVEAGAEEGRRGAHQKPNPPETTGKNFEGAHHQPNPRETTANHGRKF